MSNCSEEQLDLALWIHEEWLKGSRVKCSKLNRVKNSLYQRRNWYINGIKWWSTEPKYYKAVIMAMIISLGIGVVVGKLVFYYLKQGV